MTVRRLLLLPIAVIAAVCLAALLPGAPAAGQEEEPPEQGERPDWEADDEAFQEAVDKAIIAGTDWLVDRQADDGTWGTGGHGASYPMGATALPLLAAVKCGVHPQAEEAAAAYTALADMDIRKVYSVGLFMMAIEAKYNRPHPRTGEYPDPRKPLPVSDEDRELLENLTRFLLANRHVPEPPTGGGVYTAGARGEGLWRYPDGGYDHSCTQYALLGLRAARRCGVEIEKDVWSKVVTHFLNAQEKNGEKVPWIETRQKGEYIERRRVGEAEVRGWGYTGPQNPSGSMTTAGLACLMIADDAERSYNRRDRGPSKNVQESIRDGFAFIAENFDVETNPKGEERWHYYWLYGLERAGVFAGRKWIGTHDWYREGAIYLLENQKADGSWSSTMGGVVDTSFALLFLKRATVPLRRPVFTDGGGR